MSKIDPKNYLIFSQCPTVFINGNNDKGSDIILYDKTTRLIQEKNRYLRITPDMEHSHHYGWSPREIAVFFNSIFKGGIPLARITGIERQDTIISYSYESKLRLRKADFYYSNDTININPERIWMSLPAKIFDDRIETRCPGEGFKMGFLYVTDIMDFGVSSELIIN